MTENGKKNQQGKTAKDLVEHTDNHSIKPTPGERANNLKVLEDLPAEVRRIVSMTSLQGGVDPIPSAISSNLNESHIDKILELSEKDDERLFKDIFHSRVFNLVHVILLIALFIFLFLFLQGKDPALLKEIIKTIVIFAGGLGVGLGYKAQRKRE